MAFERLIELSGGASEDASFTQKLFSTHPDLQERVTVMSKKAEKDGFTKPAK